MQIPRASFCNILFSPAIKSAFDPKQDDNLIIYNNKVHQLAALYAKQAYKDKEEPMDRKELAGCQHQMCKAIDLVVLGFTLYKQQIDAILCLFYKQTDLLVLAKTGFGKNIIFQLLWFMTPTTGIVFILMPIKLLQTEQSQMIT